MKHAGALAVGAVALAGGVVYAWKKKLLPGQKPEAPGVVDLSGQAPGAAAAPDAGGGAAPPFAMGESGTAGPSSATPAAAPGPSSLLTNLIAANNSLGAARLAGTPGFAPPGAPTIVDPGSGGGGFHLSHVGPRTPPTPPARRPVVSGLRGIAGNPKVATAAAAVKALNASGCKAASAMRAVSAFQKAVGLPVDGKYSPQTKAAIDQWWLGPPAAPPPCKWS